MFVALCLQMFLIVIILEHAASPSTLRVSDVRVFKVPLLSWYFGGLFEVPIRLGKSSGGVQVSSSGGCLATSF
jgi:hypothetical protein